MNNVKELLPIGSVVLLEGGIKKTMVIGVKQTSKDSGEEYDYLGVMYPEGSFGEGSQYFFNHSTIRDVVFRGYENEESSEFREKLFAFYEEQH